MVNPAKMQKTLPTYQVGVGSNTSNQPLQVINGDERAFDLTKIKEGTYELHNLQNGGRVRIAGDKGKLIASRGNDGEMILTLNDKEILRLYSGRGKKPITLNLTGRNILVGVNDNNSTLVIYGVNKVNITGNENKVICENCRLTELTGSTNEVTLTGRNITEDSIKDGGRGNKIFVAI